MSVSFFVVNIINSVVMLYGSSKILNSKINWKNYKIYLAIFLLTIYSFFMYSFTQSFMRLVMQVQLYIIFNYIIHKSNNKTLSDVTCASIFTWLLLVISEVIGGIAISGILNHLKIDSSKAMAANTLISLAILTIFYIAISIKQIPMLFNRIIEKTVNYKSRDIILFVLFISVLISMVLNIINFEISRHYRLMILLIILGEYTAIIYSLLIERQRNHETKQKLDTLIDITTNYEQILEETRINVHENKNQLIVIRDMIKQGNKNSIKYIDNLIAQNYIDDNNLLLKVSPLPLGGLRGLIYYKLLTMKEKGIEASVSIGHNFNKNIFKNIDVELLQSYCKIVGVFLDNAIEAVEKSPSKIISIEIYQENNQFILNVCNQYDGKIDFESLGHRNISSKGEKHGYGLQLVEKLVRENTKLSHEKEVIGELFVQKIRINLK